MGMEREQAFFQTLLWAVIEWSEENDGKHKVL